MWLLLGKGIGFGGEIIEAESRRISVSRKEKLGTEREGRGVFSALKNWVVLRVKGLSTRGGFPSLTSCF